MIYRHTQTGWTTIYWFAVVAVIVLLVFFFVLAPRFHAVGMAVLAFLAVLGFLFSSLTVTVDERRLSWHFGPGFWKKYVSLDEIRSIEPVKTEWWWGYGIRVTPRGWMYNVSGNRAVAVTSLTVLRNFRDKEKVDLKLEVAAYAREAPAGEAAGDGEAGSAADGSATDAGGGA